MAGGPLHRHKPGSANDPLCIRDWASTAPAPSQAAVHLHGMAVHTPRLVFSGDPDVFNVSVCPVCRRSPLATSRSHRGSLQQARRHTSVPISAPVSASTRSGGWGADYEREQILLPHRPPGRGRWSGSILTTTTTRARRTRIPTTDLNRHSGCVWCGTNHLSRRRVEFHWTAEHRGLGRCRARSATVGGALCV